ncbi:MAG: soluble lytic murein transglycosylase [Acidobacteriota bacterium]|nr:soluble lytic murein transglycosylase [Acidobacteriota bacterium]
MVGLLPFSFRFSASAFNPLAHVVLFLSARQPGSGYNSTPPKHMRAICKPRVLRVIKRGTMSSSNIRLPRNRAGFVVALSAMMLLASVLPLTVASCSTQTARADEPAGYERLRMLTRGATLPAEGVVTQLASAYTGTRTGALAQLLRARIRLEAHDYAGAAALLRSEDFKDDTRVGDYALWLRGDALEKAARRAESRAAFEELARDYPDSLRARDAVIRAAQLLAGDGQASGVPAAVKKLADADDADALLLTARAYEQGGEQSKALAAFRRLYFYAPVSSEKDAEAAAGFARLGSTSAPASADEATTRAERLFKAKRYADAVAAYEDAFGRFPETRTPQTQLRSGVAAFNARRAPETIESLSAVSSSAGETRAEALSYLAQTYARAKQWPQARATLEELRRAFPQSRSTMLALVAAGQAAKDAKNESDALFFDRLAVQQFPGEPEVAGAQFEVAWAAHDAKNFAESARLLIEHLADYAGRNTDNRGKAGYWAARDSERAGNLGEAQTLYEAMLVRYEANWYGYLAKQRLDALRNAGQVRKSPIKTDSGVLARAVENLKPVTTAEETAGPAEAARLLKAEQLSAVAWDEAAHAELDRALETVPASPQLNLAKAQLYRARNDNVQALNTLKRSFPDYSQMEPEELTRDEWDVFYPLAYWDTITQESRARTLDPYTVAGLIRQESVFNPRAVSSANAYGLMQLIPETARITAKRYDVGGEVTTETLLSDPRLNIRLGTSYLREQLDKYGRIEYVAAAYNAGPGRVVAWRASLPLQIDEWAEAIPFKETRGYVQGVVRNMLQYRRLYDEQGRFRPEVGARAVRRDINASATTQQPNENTRPRRVSNEEEE